MAQQEPGGQKKSKGGRVVAAGVHSHDQVCGPGRILDSDIPVLWLRRSFWCNTKTIFMIPPTFAGAQSCQPPKGTFVSPPLLHTIAF